MLIDWELHGPNTSSHDSLSPSGMLFELDRPRDRP